MKKLLFILAFVLIGGCSQTAFAEDEPHRFPCLFWDNNAGARNISLAYKDNNAAWQVNADIVTDADPSQFVNQHNRLVYMMDGEYGFVLIENGSNDLELWQEGTAGWSADGTFTLTDDHTSNDFIQVDIITKQNGFHSIVIDNVVSSAVVDIFPDSAGTWVLTALDGTATEFSITMNKNLVSWIAGIYNIGGGGQFFVNGNYDPSEVFNYAGLNTKPQIIADDTAHIWVFSIDDVDLIVGIFPDIMTVISNTLNQVIEETIIDLTGPDEALIDYKVSVRYADNTLHVVAITKTVNGITFDYDLNYYRRDHNGWSDAMQVDTWNLDALDALAQDPIAFPQITVDNGGNILLYNVEWDAGNSRGDLQVWELDWTDYDDYTTGGNWTGTANLDDGDDDVLGCSSLNIHP